MGESVARLLAAEYAERAEFRAAVDQGERIEPLLAADVVIDFSSPAAMSALADAALALSGKLPAFVVGSTGWSDAQKISLERLTSRAPVLMASNFSVGVAALVHLLREASPLLKKLGYSPVLVETHHRHKRDAPSGTAIALQRAITPENPGAVQTHSVRSGEIIGDHEVTFYGTGDHLTLGHFAQERSIFARGAIDCALWLASGIQPAGRILGIEEYFTGAFK
jgi:4-hydroxy-tetrahydrodipicolinate reductase